MLKIPIFSAIYNTKRNKIKHYYLKYFNIVNSKLLKLNIIKIKIKFSQE